MTNQERAEKIASYVAMLKGIGITAFISLITSQLDEAVREAVRNVSMKASTQAFENGQKQGFASAREKAAYWVECNAGRMSAQELAERIRGMTND